MATTLPRLVPGQTVDGAHRYVTVHLDPHSRLFVTAPPHASLRRILALIDVSRSFAAPE